MRNALVLVVIALLAAACGKKQAPAGPKSPADATQPAKEGEKESAPDVTPMPRGSDPCEGGEGNDPPKTP